MYVRANYAELSTPWLAQPATAECVRNFPATQDMTCLQSVHPFPEAIVERIYELARLKLSVFAE